MLRVVCEKCVWENMGQLHGQVCALLRPDVFPTAQYFPEMLQVALLPPTHFGAHHHPPSWRV